MPSGPLAPLSALTAGVQRLALVGLAKNTGKTQALAALLAEHAAGGRPVGVTSIGRDGERRDVLDARIEKPAIHLPAGSLVATSCALLRASGVEHEALLQTGMRTPLGEVVLARLTQAGALEVAGPSAADDVRALGQAMLELGAAQVLIDGAIDRRAASSPEVADGLVLATGAVLDADIARVVSATADAVELVRLPRAPAARGKRSVLVDRRLVLNAEPAQVAQLLREHPRAQALRVEGALGERFLQALLAARRERAGRELSIVVGDPTKAFLSRRGPGWYRRQGVALEVLRPIELKAITVNPRAPRSHSFDSSRLRELIEAAVPDVPVVDVLDESYLAVSS